MRRNTKINVISMSMIAFTIATVFTTSLVFGLSKGSDIVIAREFDIDSTTTRKDLIDKKGTWEFTPDAYSTWEDNYWPAIKKSGYLKNKNLMENDFANSLWAMQEAMMAVVGVTDWTGNIKLDELKIEKNWWEWKNISMISSFSETTVSGMLIKGIEYDWDIMSIGGTGMDRYSRNEKDNDYYVSWKSLVGIPEPHETIGVTKANISHDGGATWEWETLEEANESIFDSYYLEGIFNSHN